MPAVRRKVLMQAPAKKWYEQCRKRVALGPKPVNVPTPPSTTAKEVPLFIHKPLRPSSKNGSVATTTNNSLRNSDGDRGYTLEPCTMKPYKVTETVRDGRGRGSRNITYTRIAQPPKEVIVPIAKDAKKLEKEAFFNSMIAEAQAKKDKEKGIQRPQQQQQQQQQR
ncbi:hypothetical protein LTR72_003515 [Exophiala xenobiotica]|nr:hypothetical protein LTR41_004372 [Exophiala xenobiotica]KAK5225612.1 hypothetical protein LTR72_003515 [Exophiala xenobiotica]KAK5298432.1 hypothetical protein LTR14_002283 [Exophiala xenobiotica]KAK5330360.1 hypothetical protein LTR93_001949 [Exophiala xenobiotica]KAK5417302.1 hypothetical protein LTR06_003289 [Exophiala xenobiotica]